MTKLWKNGRFADDGFVALDDAAALVPGVAVRVSLARWRAGRPELLAHDALVAVLVDPAAVLVVEADALDELTAIVIPFAKFSDGRGYSLARRLRDELHFKGEIRATGDVLLDQLPLMLRCGFDAFVIVHAPTIAALEAGHLPAISEVYQEASRGRARATLGTGTNFLPPTG
jgi:uncharacterized protein (DUF934 family)